MADSTFTPVEQILERKSHPVTRDAEAAPTHDMHETLFELEAKGEIIVQKVPEPYILWSLRTHPWICLVHSLASSPIQFGLPRSHGSDFLHGLELLRLRRLQC